MHWHKMFSWCQGKGTDAAEMLPCYPICGYDAASQCAGASVDARDTGIGFRPVFEVDGLDALPDGMLVTVGALYMDGSLVKVGIFRISSLIPRWSSGIPWLTRGITSKPSRLAMF